LTQVALSLIVARTPFLSLAPFALKELDTIYRIFANVAEECSKVAQALVSDEDNFLEMITKIEYSLYSPKLQRSHVGRTPSGSKRLEIARPWIPS
jgi:hypothetical protein